MPPRTHRNDLRDREAELAALDRAGHQAAGGAGALVVIEGPAGIGKTALLETAAATARERRMRVSVARGQELEREFGFGVARQLLGPLLTDHAPALHPVAAEMAVAAIGPEVPDAVSALPGPDASFATLNALHQLTALAATTTPLLLGVDDAQDADPASLRLLAYLAGRLGPLAVCLIVTVRSSPAAVPTAISRLISEPGAQVLRPRQLGIDGARSLMRMQMPEASDAVCDACWTASGGNPFFLHELGEALRDAGVEAAGDARAAARVAELLPAGVQEAVRARIHRLPRSAARLARSLAVMGDGALLRHGATLAGLDMDAASAAADALVTAEILAPERPPRFLHPLIRTALEGDLAPGERARAHGAAARLLSEEGAAPERVAAHLLAAEPAEDPLTTGWLRDAARLAVRRGAPEAAVAYLRRALEEPPEVDLRPAILLDLGEAEALTHTPRAAAEHLRGALGGLTEPESRLRAALILAEILSGEARAADGVAVLEATLTAATAEVPAERRERIVAHLANIARTDIESRRRTTERAAWLRRRAREGRLRSGVALAAAAAEEAMAAESLPLTRDHALRAIAAVDAEGTFPGDFTRFTAVRCLLACDRFTEARALLDRAEEQAQLLGASAAAATSAAFFADLHLRTGDITAAVAAGERSLGCASEGWALGVPAASAFLAEALVQQGEVEAAMRTITEAGLTGPAAQAGSSYSLTMLLHARGRARSAAGETGAALDDLLETGRRQTLMGELNPALIPWRSTAARTMARAGQLDAALDLAREEVALARRFAAPSALGRALIAEGEIDAGPVGEVRLREAERLLGGTAARLLHAEALWVLGRRLTDTGSLRAARDALTEALDVAAACGAVALQGQVMSALRASGARPRRLAVRGVEALTDAERRIAVMAARGMSNREIADEMYLSVRTVEFHLRSTYRKLGVRSRKDLGSHDLVSETVERRATG